MVDLGWRQQCRVHPNGVCGELVGYAVSSGVRQTHGVSGLERARDKIRERRANDRTSLLPAVEPLYPLMKQTIVLWKAIWKEYSRR